MNDEYLMIPCTFHPIKDKGSVAGNPVEKMSSCINGCGYRRCNSTRSSGGTHSKYKIITW